MENSKEGDKKLKLRERILETALTLFNERGYLEVSMRNVSDSLGISVGNLTYHFKKKEDLVEAVVLEQHKNYKKPEIPRTLEELDACFRRVLGHQEKNAYYFHNYKQLGQISSRVFQIQKKVIQDLRDMIDGAFQNLKSSGLLKTDELPGQSENLIRVTLSLCAYGVVFENTNPIDSIWSLIYPLLTESGRAIYHSRIIAG
jgi:AcrR family transcriptional regulator